MFCALSATAGSDFHVEWEKAAKLARSEKNEEAINAFLALGAKSRLRDENYKCVKRAAMIADRLKKLEKALALTKNIKNVPLSKLCRMEILVKNKKYGRLIEEFADEDLALWPENCVGPGFYLRGLAFSKKSQPAEAVRDLTQAAKYYPDKLGMGLFLLTLGNVYKKDIKDEDKAVGAYLKAALNGRKYAWTTRIAIGNVVGYYVKRRRFADARAFLMKFPVASLSGGSWKSSMLFNMATILEAEGKVAEARTLYAKIANDPGTPKYLELQCATRIKKMK